MEKNVAFIGYGNIAQALIQGILNAKIIDSTRIMASSPGIDKLDNVPNINLSTSNLDSAKFGDIIFLTIKPTNYFNIINEIKDQVKEGSIIITVAPGISISQIKEEFNKGIKVVRTMPNTAVFVGEGMTGLSFCDKIKLDEMKEIITIFEAVGGVEIVDENLMDVVSAISGSSPAFVYMFVESLASGGVLKGMKWDVAYNMAAQAVLGAAKMMLESDKHAAILKEEVASPGGTTIEGIYHLEKSHFRGTVMETIEKCYDKCKSLSIRK